MEQAACKDMAPSDGESQPDVFFPERGQASLGNIAVITCFHCPVRAACDEYKERTGCTDGIWAGKYVERGPKAE